MLQDEGPVAGSAEHRILAVARKRFGEFGYRRTNIAEIARDAGLAVGTVYRYFKGKEELFLGVIRDLNDSWEREARHALGGRGDAMERLKRLGAASVRFNAANPLLGALLARDTEIIFAPLLDQIYEDHIGRIVAMMADVVRQGVAEGTFQPVDAERTAWVLFLGGATLSQQHRYPYGELMPLFETIIYDGLLPRRTRGGRHAHR